MWLRRSPRSGDNFLPQLQITLNLLVKKVKRSRIPQLRQLPTSTVAGVRQRQMADSTHRTNQRPRSPVSRVEPLNVSPSDLATQCLPSSVGSAQGQTRWRGSRTSSRSDLTGMSPDQFQLAQPRRAVVQRTHRPAPAPRHLHQRPGPRRSDRHVGRALEPRPETLRLAQNRPGNHRQGPPRTGRPPRNQTDH